MFHFIDFIFSSSQWNTSGSLQTGHKVDGLILCIYYYLAVGCIWVCELPLSILVNNSPRGMLKSSLSLFLSLFFSLESSEQLT